MKYQKTEQDYLGELTDQLHLLIDYCNRVDHGNLLYAKPMATLLRVLVHLTPNSKSLFSLLQKQRGMKFCSTSKSYPNFDDIIYLVTLITPVQKPIIRDSRVVGHDLIFVPNLTRNTNPKNWVTFDEWYDLPIFIVNKNSDDGLILLDQTQNSKLVISRKNVITYFANKDGGAHVDSKVDLDLYNLAKSLSSIAYHDIKPQYAYKPGEKYVPGIPYQDSLHAAIRQIAHETISTIGREFGLRASYNPTHKLIAGYKLENTCDTCIRFNPETRQTSITN